ncbi:ABC transporter family protein [Francisella tularensis subsp. holarctica]|uniref:ABC transporter family protein n=2 Tax=Francisella tularensis TaxID=263 RepID=A0AAI8BJ10_FRATH|nr:ATP-binding cassette domain-containing protein [Francisella tularensis]MCX3330737.1 ATP-binding cassette domain-containing protein [Bacillus pacificus]AJI51682.1 ABC transporter family protein [Francisella tularensis subsp. holarctica]AJI59832.1 ABC transporter family protein [Francisella tularensis subsp. holarctica LVS]AJI64899.1 ABC transporter family protein [Francisella tularensis subsp. holarctica]AJI66801.1 ABC transporter family protein [Francisella tularensis subsp. holarctica]
MFYPFFANISTDDEFKQILGFLGIGYLAKFINSIHEWRNILSCGEQQKLRLCKIFTKAYDLILLDEATSNIDAKSEKKSINYLRIKV